MLYIANLARVGRDLNMEFVHRIGWNLSHTQFSHLRGKSKIAHLVHQIGGPLINSQDLHLLTADECVTRVRAAVKTAVKIWTPPYGVNKAYISIILRLWSGCISGAKIIAHGTRSGLNTPKKRKKWFRMLLRACRIDRVFHLGVKSCVAYKRMLNQGYSYAGGEKKVLREIFGRKF